MCCVALAEGSGEMNLPVSPTKLAAAAGPRGTELLLRGGPSCAQDPPPISCRRPRRRGQSRRGESLGSSAGAVAGWWLVWPAGSDQKF